MNILYLNNWNHPKNHNALMNYKNINFIRARDICDVDLTKFDAVYSPSVPINTMIYPNTKFIFGPHFSVFPNSHQIDMISNSNSVYIQPSEWAAKVWQDNDICSDIKIDVLPFGVNTIDFNQTKTDRNSVFIYYKRRNPDELNLIKNLLDMNNIKYVLFSYSNGYKENDYIQYLHDSKYGIWLGCHESQGFALQEALSCNVPLFVWSVTSMSQEYKAGFNHIPATSIPYWDERCGEYFYDKNELETKFNLFLSKLDKYSPREYILNTLTMEHCEQKLINLVQSLSN